MSKVICLTELAEKQILVLDGAMGTMIQKLDLCDADFVLNAEARSIGAPGCNDLLSLTRPDVILDIHKEYLKSGANIIKTNTFGANRFALSEYGLSDKVYDINFAAAKLAQKAVEAHSVPAYVAGVLGPTGRTASFSHSLDDPAHRESTFSDFTNMYREQISALLDGHVDALLIETVFDTLVAKAALTAAMQLFVERGESVPIMVSATFSDKSRRTLSGQTLEAFITSLSSFPLFSLGINCSTGAAEMLPLIRDLANISPFRTSAHPNAGFPDREGNYLQTPGDLVDLMAPLLEEGCLSIVGGCCGTTPEHIAALAQAAAKGKPHKISELEPVLRLSGWEPLILPVKHQFVTVGERANVAGSRKFARMIKEKRYEEALSLARLQVKQGAQIIDICMDDPFIDAPEAMVRFLRLAAADPIVACVPVMVDSSSWPVIQAALPELQGRGVVNSISLKEGEKQFLARARYINSMGAAVMVMLFDEQGQADTFERKCSVTERSYRLLVETGTLDPTSIIFDPNILSIATGIDEHDVYARDFIRAVSWIKERFPLVKISGGLSNLSFSFRGNNALREVIHAIFLKLAVSAGLDMAIVNPAMEYGTDAIPLHAAEIIKEALLLERGDGPAARNALIELALSDSLNAKDTNSAKSDLIDSWRAMEVADRLSEAVIRGDDTWLARDLEEAGEEEAVDLIEGPLMAGMSRVGVLFGEGKLFLPQVVRSARMMKKAVDILKPRLEQSTAVASHSAGTVVLATVKGDVHDIGKNIVSLVLRCNNFKVIDLGVMVPAETILQTAIEEHADMVGLSGLITPSLMEMATICRLFEQKDVSVPILIGGATTSETHTAVKLAPLCPGKVVHTSDASHSVSVALKLVSPLRNTFLEETTCKYKELADQTRSQKISLLELETARKGRYRKSLPAPTPVFHGVHVVNDITLENLIPIINWRMLAMAWQVSPVSEEAARIEMDAKALLEDPSIRKVFNGSLRAVVGVFPAFSQHEKVFLFDPSGNKRIETFHFLRKQEVAEGETAWSLADFVQEGDSVPRDTMGLFVVSAGMGIAVLADELRSNGDDYHSLLVTMLADRLAEALSEYLHERMSKEWWQYGDISSIRPAPGYPSAPDHAEKQKIFSVLNATKQTGIMLTDHFAMEPAASICGYYFVGEGIRYFSLGPIGHDQLEYYAQEKGVSSETLEKTLGWKFQATEKEYDIMKPKDEDDESN